MKKLIVAIALCFAVSAQAQTKKKTDKDESANVIVETEVPEAIRAAFKTKYPRVKTVQWEKEDALFEAKFTMAAKNYGVEYKEDATWVKTAIEMDVKMLPGQITSALDKSKYAKYKVVEAEEISTPAYKKAYELNLTKKKEKIEIIVDPKGAILEEPEANN